MLLAAYRLGFELCCDACGVTLQSVSPIVVRATSTLSAVTATSATSVTWQRMTTPDA